MWIPKNEQDILTATANGSLEETLTFDAKKELPPKNSEIAKDASAMANTAGGVILFGIEEDASGRPTIPTPFELKGEREKIDNIIRTSVSEVPSYTISAIESQADATKGYLVLVIPPSERAPHMVIVKGERRYYGRGETGNYVLSEPEVARLYERREITKTSILPLLERITKDSPNYDGFANLNIVIKPVIQDEDLLNKVVNSEQNHKQFLDKILLEAINFRFLSEGYTPNFSFQGWIHRPEGFLSKMSERLEKNHETYSLFLQVNFDGRGNLFCSRAAETLNIGNTETKWFFSDIVAGNTVKFLRFFGELYEKTSYFGMVDIGVGLKGLENSIDFGMRNYFSNYRYFENDDYYRTKRTSASTLKEDSKQIASDLVLPLISAMTQGKYNPFINN